MSAVRIIGTTITIVSGGADTIITIALIIGTTAGDRHTATGLGTRHTIIRAGAGRIRATVPHRLLLLPAEAIAPEREQTDSNTVRVGDRAETLRRVAYTEGAPRATILRESVVRQAAHARVRVLPRERPTSVSLQLLRADPRVPIRPRAISETRLRAPRVRPSRALRAAAAVWVAADVALAVVADAEDRDSCPIFRKQNL